jgi:NADH-quinone oxidoreductase subunit H
MVNTLLVIWFERRVIGRMQQRPGPNRTGPFGLLQTLADGVKLALKEDMTPKAADKVVFIAAPAIAGRMASCPSRSSRRADGQHVRSPHAAAADRHPVAVLFVLAVAASGSTASCSAAGPPARPTRCWAGCAPRRRSSPTRSPWACRWSPSSCTAVDVDLQIVDARATVVHHPGVLSFVVYVITMVGETNRLPFDLAEGEGELTGGFHTEYSSLKFALFFLAEYVNMVTVSALATTMFLGGWRAPGRIAADQRRMFNRAGGRCCGS